MKKIINLVLKLKERFWPDRKFREARIWSNNELSKIAHLFSGDIINVSGWMDSDKRGGFYKSYFTNAKSYSISNYEGHMGYQGGEIKLDLEKELPPDLVNKYDAVFNHTTLEHIYKMETAFKNLCLMTRDTVIVVVPFLQQMHFDEESLSYKDYWRFTPYALKRMFEDNNMEMVYCVGDTSNDHSIYVLAVGSKNPSKWKIEYDKDVFNHLGDKIIK